MYTYMHQRSSLQFPSNPITVHTHTYIHTYTLPPLTIFSFQLRPTLQLTNEQRTHLRKCLQTMTMILIQHSDSDKEVIPIIDFIATCSDNIVLNEVADMLLLLVVEGDQKLISQIVSAFHGVEEYAAFMLFHLVHQPFEELRCTGLRLLTHLYLRIHSISSSILSLSLKRGKRIASRIGLLSVSYQGLQRYCNSIIIISSHISSNHVYV